MAIVSIKHKGLKLLWTKGNKSKLEAELVPTLERRLNVLDQTERLEDLAATPALSFHALTGTDRYSIKVNKNWRLTFEFEDGDVYILDFEDYH